MQARFYLADESKTMACAAILAKALVAPLVFAFQGDLGTGKTALIRGMLQSLGVSGRIKSPTFALVESYALPNFSLHHFDLYRLSEETELDALGFRDYFTADAVCCIEWAERAPNLKSCVDVLFSLEVQGAGRLLSVTAFTPLGEALLDALRREFV